MKLATWHFFDTATGLFTGAAFAGTEDDLDRQLVHKGPSFGAHEGEHVDHLSQRLDLQTWDLVDHTPEPPRDGTDLTLYVWWWDRSIKRWKIRPRLRKLRQDKWAEIKAARDAETSAPLLTKHGTFDHDGASRAAIASKAQICAATGRGIAYTLTDNSQVDLTAAQMIDVCVNSHDHEQRARTTAATLRLQIDAAASAEALNLITWPQRPGGL